MVALPTIKEPDLSILIATYNAKDTLVGCLNSLYKNNQMINFETIVINNGPFPLSSGLKNQFPDILCIENNKNLGFAKAINQGIHQATGKYLLCLNDDTIILPSSLNKLLNFMNSNPEAIAAGGKVLNLDGSIQFSCRKFPNYLTALFNRQSLLTRIFKNNRFSTSYLMSDWPHDEVRQIDWVSGCYLIIRRDAIEKVGFMDERFFMYCEDIDWCYRAKDMGLKVYYVPDAPIIHLNKGYGDNFAKNIIEHHKSIYRFYKKHYKRKFFMELTILFSIGIRTGFILLLNYLVHSKIKKPTEDMLQTVRIF